MNFENNIKHIFNYLHNPSLRSARKVKSAPGAQTLFRTGTAGALLLRVDNGGTFLHG